MRIRILSPLVISLLLAAPLAAQEAPFNFTEVSNFDQNGQRYADVWGDGNFAYVAHFKQNRVDIVNISNPSDPTLSASYSVPSPNDNASTVDVKVHNGMMFVALDDDGKAGVDIVDVRTPGNPTHKTFIDLSTGTFADVENIFYEGGWLYLANGTDNTFAVIDLTGYSLNNPPSTISDARWIVGGVGNSRVRDLTAQNGRLYVSASDKFEIFDITDNANQAPQLLASMEGNEANASWPTVDDNYVVVAEERSGGDLLLYEISGAGSLTLTLRDTFSIPTNRAISPHNPVVNNFRVFVSYYQVGVQVLDIDPATDSWQLVASFDTTADSGGNGFEGCWGVYPFLSENTVLASDIDEGLFVLDLLLQPPPTDVVYVDWRNNGFEDGSQANPFNTIAEALSQVDAGGQIIIYSGNYNETFTNTSKAVTFTSTGGSVSIGT